MQKHSILVQLFRSSLAHILGRDSIWHKGRVYVEQLPNELHVLPPWLCSSLVPVLLSNLSIVPICKYVSIGFNQLNVRYLKPYANHEKGSRQEF